MQLLFFVRKQQEIIHITQIRRALQLMLDEHIQLVQVDIGPELAGEVADQHFARPQQGKQIISRKQGLRRFAHLDAGTAVDNAAD